jgi:hypothetical protein
LMIASIFFIASSFRGGAPPGSRRNIRMIHAGGPQEKPDNRAGFAEARR